MPSNLSSERDSSPRAGLSQAAPDGSGPKRSVFGKESGREGQQHPRRLSEQQEQWQLARRWQQEDRIVEATPTGFNKGGLILDWNGLPGFVPASQLTDFPNLHVEEQRLRHLQIRQHEKLRLKIIEVDERSNRLIFSERASQVAATARAKLIDELEAGEKRTGVVTNLADFGAFVDLGGIEGLVHISQLSWRRLFHPGDVVQPGDEIEVLVLNVDKDEERVALSRKRLTRDPWPTVEERYSVDQIVEGTISNIVGYGAFTLVEQELEGLIHISELKEGGCSHPSEVVHKGQRVRARVLSVNSRDRRLALSLRRVG